jgi:hypothetical protein
VRHSLSLTVNLATTADMLFNGRVSDGATIYFDTNRALQSIAGSGYWFAKFHSVNCTGLPFMYRLMEILFNVNVCCHVGDLTPHI